jgi:hypothetical protein
MSHLDVKIPHKLSVNEALKRIKKSLAALQDRHRNTLKHVSEEWDGPEGSFSFSAKGLSVAGKIHVGTDEIHLSSRLPIMLSAWKKKIAEVIQEKGAELLAA